MFITFFDKHDSFVWFKQHNTNLETDTTLLCIAAIVYYSFTRHITYMYTHRARAVLRMCLVILLTKSLVNLYACCVFNREVRKRLRIFQPR